jgi:hypothetical protein
MKYQSCSDKVCIALVQASAVFLMLPIPCHWRSAAYPLDAQDVTLCAQLSGKIDVQPILLLLLLFLLLLLLLLGLLEAGADVRSPVMMMTRRGR